MTDGHEYEAVFWDVGGVLVELESMREGYERFVRGLAAEYGLDPESAFETWTDELGAYFRDREGTEYDSAAAGYRRATAALFDDPPPEEVWRPRFERATAEALRAEPGAVETVRALDEASLHLGIVSDIDTREARAALARLDVADCFDGLTTSEAVGYRKPDARMFEDAIEKAGVAPARAVHVGDRYRHDVEGAAAVGLDAVAYGADADGPAADYAVDDLRDLLAVVGVAD